MTSFLATPPPISGPRSSLEASVPDVPLYLASTAPASSLPLTPSRWDYLGKEGGEGSMLGV